MDKNYYKKKQNIALLDENNNIRGGIERWDAHEKGFLHRAFTVVIKYKNLYVVQHRKHPVFDDIYDVTSSSHPSYENGKLQNMLEAVRITLNREWDLTENEYGEIKDLGVVDYEASDPNSKYKEHEHCEIFEVEVSKEPTANKEYAYGDLLATKQELTDKNSKIYKKLAPWVKVAIDQNLL